MWPLPQEQVWSVRGGLMPVAGIGLEGRSDVPEEETDAKVEGKVRDWRGSNAANPAGAGVADRWSMVRLDREWGDRMVFPTGGSGAERKALGLLAPPGRSRR